MGGGGGGGWRGRVNRNSAICMGMQEECPILLHGEVWGGGGRAGVGLCLFRPYPSIHAISHIVK